MTLLECPFCGSTNLKDCYVFIHCCDCLSDGPKANGGNYDDHADFVDHELAVQKWNTRYSGKKK